MKTKLIFLIFLLIIPSLCFSATSVFYSISPFGTGDIKTGSPTLTISYGVATLSVAQTENIGVGCCIDYDPNNTLAYIAPNRIGFDSGGTTELKVNTKIEGGTSGAIGIIRAIEVTGGSWAGGDASGWIYLSETDGTWENNEQINRTKPSISNNIATVDGVLNGNIGNGNTQFVVKKADGSDADNVGSSETINSIHHEYASLSAYEAGFIDANHINNADLTNVNVIAYGCCYYDHDDSTKDTTNVTIDWTGTTSSTNYLQIFTPTGSAEAINNQRHDGTANNVGYILQVEGGNAFTVNEDYSKIIGLEVRLDGAGVNISDECFRAASNYLSVSHCILWTDELDGDTDGFYQGDTSYTVYIDNCIIYGFQRGGIHPQNYSNSITITQNWYVYNCTILGCGAVEELESGAICVRVECATSTINVYVSNTIGMNTASTYDDFAEYRVYGTANWIGNNNITSDITANKDALANGLESRTATASSSPGVGDWVIFENITAGSEDFHLQNSAENDAQDEGVSLIADGTLPIWDDIDKDERKSQSDIGADEYIVDVLPQILLIQH